MFSNLLLSLACALSCLGVAAAQPGALVIAGGALDRGNAAVHQAFIERAGPEGRIVIIPAASGEPAGAAQKFTETLVSHGVAAARIEVARLAVLDDPTTADVDESSWRHGANDAAEIAKIARADGVWMSGGDQSRLIEALYDASGAETPMLAAMRARLAAGAVIGGTSAGAAVMSGVMIARGDSLAALIEPVRINPAEETADERGAMVLTRGLGLLPFGMIDQHFDAQARLGRLTRALGTAPLSRRIGFGVDEDTALIIDLARGDAHVLGAGSVVVIDAARARFSTRRGRFSAENVRLHVINDGDRISLDTLQVTPAETKTRIAPDAESASRAPPDVAGMATASVALERMLGADLLDNAAATVLERASFRNDGAGVLYRFEQGPEAAAYLGRDAHGRARRAALSVTFAVTPISISIRRR